MRVDQRQALATLGKPRLQELAAAFELDVPAAALKDDVVDLLARSRRASFERLRDRGGGTLFIDVRKLGTMVDRVHRELTADNVGRVASVRVEQVEDDGEPFAEKMERLVATLGDQFTESPRLEEAIRRNLGRLGYGQEEGRGGWARSPQARDAGNCASAACTIARKSR